MASLFRSPAIFAVRSAASRSKTVLPKPRPSRRAVPLISRSTINAALMGSESLMPLHSAIASARLRSFIAVDSCRWSWLSQELAIPR